ncbi:MAG TPA: LacI family DNA-binding transcriptional regulator [Actinotalea sp.]
MATIGDVAREAGVARSTVSAVLNGRKLVLPDTRARVEAAIEKLDYSVNSGARALATARTMTLGLVVRFHEAEFSPALATYIVAITDAAREHGYGMLLLTETDGAAAIRKAIAGRQVDGLVLLSVVEGDPRIEPLAAADFPAVLVGMPQDTRGLDAVDLDFAAAARMLVDHLVEAGHQEATFLTWPEEVFVSGRTYARRFRDASLDQAGARGMRLELIHCTSGPDQVRDALRAALTRPGAPEALLVHNDAAIAMLPMVMHDLNLAVPDDRSVVSLYSAELGRLYALPYTSVESQPETVSEIAVDLLVRRLADTGAPRGTHRLVAPILTPRASVRHAAQA